MSEERTRPERVRLSGLQEAQLPSVVELEQACIASYLEIGFNPAQIHARTLPEIVALTRLHNLRVAEADHEVAGYMAWRDEPPGVAYVEALLVHPSFQRLGIGSRLLERVREEASSAGLVAIVLPVWEKALWATAFCRRHGFAPIDERAPGRVQAWRDDGAREPVQSGQTLLWASVGESTSFQ